jgi:hypothetical protein
MFPAELPAGGEIWSVDGVLYAVYYVPETDVPLLYEFTTGFEGLEPSRTLTQQEIDRMGGVRWGIAAELSGELGESHWDIFMSQLERQSQTKPWLVEPGALAWVVDAWLRGDAPIEGVTQWEQSLNKDQRDWLMMLNADPQTAQVRVEQARDRVRNEAMSWLGPYYGNLSDVELDQWAQRLASNEDQTSTELSEYLRQTRLAAFPEWTDPNMGYEQIARIARQLFTQVWGESPDETDPLFLRVASGRDHVASMEMLRKEGWDRGVGQVVQDAVGGLLAATGGQVRRPM